MNFLRNARVVFLVISVVLPASLHAQKTQSQPVTDSSAQASPTSQSADKAVTDTSQQASPIHEQKAVPLTALPAHATIHVTLSDGIDSGNLKNGQLVHGKLSSVVSTNAHERSATRFWKAGAPVILDVVATVPAGKLNAVGEISLQAVSVAGQAVDTNILTFRGDPGNRELPDSAPVIGTNAGLPAGSALTFTLQPAPTFAESAPGSASHIPGSVTARASGSKPADYGQPAVSAAPGSGVGPDGSTQSVLSPRPGNATPASTTQPH